MYVKYHLTLSQTRTVRTSFKVDWWCCKKERGKEKMTARKHRFPTTVQTVLTAHCRSLSYSIYFFSVRTRVIYRLSPTESERSLLTRCIVTLTDEPSAIVVLSTKLRFSCSSCRRDLRSFLSFSNSKCNPNSSLSHFLVILFGLTTVRFDWYCLLPIYNYYFSKLHFTTGLHWWSCRNNGFDQSSPPSFFWRHLLYWMARW